MGLPRSHDDRQRAASPVDGVVDLARQPAAGPTDAVTSRLTVDRLGPTVLVIRRRPLCLAPGASCSSHAGVRG